MLFSPSTFVLVILACNISVSRSKKNVLRMSIVGEGQTLITDFDSRSVLKAIKTHCCCLGRSTILKGEIHRTSSIIEETSLLERHFYVATANKTIEECRKANCEAFNTLGMKQRNCIANIINSFDRETMARCAQHRKRKLSFFLGSRS
jgi:hypothetical protein